MDIKKFIDTLENAKNIIKADILNYFKKVNYSVANNQIQIKKVVTEKDFNKIFNGCGLYIILTDYPTKPNSCSFKYLTTTAIYRGHGYKVRNRLKSHLINKTYNKKRKEDDPHYKVCLKIDDKVNGININLAPYNKFNWYVIVHKMQKSILPIREQAELAFDLKYKKPVCSREQSTLQNKVK